MIKYLVLQVTQLLAKIGKLLTMFVKNNTDFCFDITQIIIATEKGPTNAHF